MTNREYLNTLDVFERRDKINQWFKNALINLEEGDDVFNLFNAWLEKEKSNNELIYDIIEKFERYANAYPDSELRIMDRNGETKDYKLYDVKIGTQHDSVNRLTLVL